MCISDYKQTTFFHLGNILKKLADDPCSSVTTDSIFHIKHMFIQPFTMGVDAHTVFLLCTAVCDKCVSK